MLALRVCVLRNPLTRWMRDTGWIRRCKTERGDSRRRHRIDEIRLLNLVVLQFRPLIVVDEVIDRGPE